MLYIAPKYDILGSIKMYIVVYRIVLISNNIKSYYFDFDSIIKFNF